MVRKEEWSLFRVVFNRVPLYTHFMDSSSKKLLVRMKVLGIILRTSCKCAIGMVVIAFMSACVESMPLLCCAWINEHLALKWFVKQELKTIKYERWNFGFALSPHLQHWICEICFRILCNCMLLLLAAAYCCAHVWSFSACIFCISEIVKCSFWFSLQNV